MAWTDPSPRSAGEFIDEAIWNQDIVANTIALRAGGLALASQAAGDLLYASSSTQLARLGITNGRVLVSSGGVPVWGSTLPAVSGANLTSLNADNISSGTLNNARLPSTISVTTLQGAGSGITNLNASNLASGTIPDARFPATLPALNGSALTTLNATALASGTINVARFPTGGVTWNAALTLTGGTLGVARSNGDLSLRDFSTTAVELHIRPDSGKGGWISFTEDSVGDRFALGIAPGVNLLQIRDGTPTGTTLCQLADSGNLTLSGDVLSSGASLNDHEGRIDALELAVFSDATLKEPLPETPWTPDAVRSLVVRDFRWTATGEETRGVFAQDVAAVLGPDAVVAVGREQWLGIRPLRLIAELLAAWQFSDREIQALKAEIAASNGGA